MYNHEKISFVITRFEDLFCWVTEEPKKNTKANKKNKRNIVIFALCCKLTNELDSMRWKSFPTLFTFLEHENSTWNTFCVMLLTSFVKNKAQLTCWHHATFFKSDLHRTSPYNIDTLLKSPVRRIKRIIKRDALFWRTAQFSLIAISKQN